jgi:hypothetical protein
MPPHFGALFFTWLAGSLTTGLISTVQGNVENLVGDGSFLGIVDATAGWLLYTFPYAVFVIAIFFLPMAVFLEWRGARALPFYVGAGLIAVALHALVVAPSSFGRAFGLLALPAVIGSMTWWAIAIWRTNSADANYV